MNNTFSIINQIHFLHNRVVAMLLRKHLHTSMNAAQMRLIMSLWEKDHVSLRELCEQNCVKKTTLSTMLPKMLELGLVEVRTDIDDRRSRIISLTEKSKGIIVRHDEYQDLFENALFTGVSDSDRAAFHRVLLKLKENLINKEKEPASERNK